MFDLSDSPRKRCFEDKIFSNFASRRVFSKNFLKKRAFTGMWAIFVFIFYFLNIRPETTGGQLPSVFM